MRDATLTALALTGLIIAAATIAYIAYRQLIRWAKHRIEQLINTPLLDPHQHQTLDDEYRQLITNESNNP